MVFGKDTTLLLKFLLPTLCPVKVLTLRLPT